MARWVGACGALVDLLVSALRRYVFAAYKTSCLLTLRHDPFERCLQMALHGGLCLDRVVRFQRFQNVLVLVERGLPRTFVFEVAA